MDVCESSGFQLEGHDVGEYTIASGKTQRALIKKVNALISNQWFPIGGVVAFQTADGSALLQALIRSRAEQGKRVAQA